MTIGVIVGLEAEARLARRWGLPVRVGGGSALGAAAAAAALDGVAGIISVGLAGGLDPVLRAGDLIVPRRVIDDDGAWETDLALNAALGGCTGHTLRGGGTVLATVTEKRAAFCAGAAAVDLESAAVAREAARRGLPFAALRAICDGAGRILPLAALLALDDSGRIGLLRVAIAALSHPRELPALIGLARDAARARSALAGRIRTTPGLNGCP